MKKKVFLILPFIFLIPARGEALVINEVAWMGTPSSFNNEWIELYNNYDRTIELEGWQLVFKAGQRHISLRGTLPPFSFYILEYQLSNIPLL